MRNLIQIQSGSDHSSSVSPSVSSPLASSASRSIAVTSSIRCDIATPYAIESSRTKVSSGVLRRLTFLASSPKLGAFRRAAKRPARWLAFGSGVCARRLVFGNLRDGAHGAFLEALAARDAGVFVHDLGNTAGNFQDLLRASVNADTTTNAFVSGNNGMGHDGLLLSVCLPLNLSAVQDTITSRDCKPSDAIFGNSLDATQIEPQDPQVSKCGEAARRRACPGYVDRRMHCGQRPSGHGRHALR